MNPDAWKNIDPESTDAIGQAYTRLDWLMRNDPFASMLSTQVRDALPAALYYRLFNKDGTLFRLRSVEKWDRNIQERMEAIPYAALWTNKFKDHLRYLAVRAVMPQGDLPKED